MLLVADFLLIVVGFAQFVRIADALVGLFAVAVAAGVVRDALVAHGPLPPDIAHTRVGLQ